MKDLPLYQIRLSDQNLTVPRKNAMTRKGFAQDAQHARAQIGEPHRGEITSHNLKVVGSNPTPATTTNSVVASMLR